MHKKGELRSYDLLTKHTRTTASRIAIHRATCSYTLARTAIQREHGTHARDGLIG